MPAGGRALVVALVVVLASCTRWNGTPVEARPAADLGALKVADQRGKVVVLAFGFTTCPDVCPRTLSTMRSAYRLLGADAEEAVMAFVTVDPDRDLPDRLASYVGAFDARIVPVFVEGSALPDALAAYGATAEKRLPDPDRYARFPRGASYTVDHTAGFFLVDRRGRLRLHVRDEEPASALVADIRRLLAEPTPPPVRIEAPVAHVAPSGVGAVYLRIVNPSGEEDRLLAVESEAAERVELHESVRSGDVVRMLSREEGFQVPPHATVELSQGGKHLMMLGVTRRDGATPLALTLRFARSGAVSVEVPVSGPP